MTEEKVPEKKKSDTVLVVAILGLILVFLGFFFVPKLFPEKVVTLPELFEQNEQGKLSESEGYVYKGQSFVLFDELWYTRVINPARTRQINIPFHYGPREVADIQPVGFLNFSIFNEADAIYMTFDPTDDNLQYIGVAISEVNGVLINAFGKAVIAACTNDQDPACENRPIVDCDTPGDIPILYFASEEETNVLYTGNCAIVAGHEEELWRATDRMLFDFLDFN